MTVQTTAPRADILTSARLKITLLYLVMGGAIFVVGGYLVYDRIVAVIVSALASLRNLAATHATGSSTAIASIIESEIRQMNLEVGAWILVAIIVAAWLLATLTLEPVKAALEREQHFMANISHELRTPLSIMKTNAEVALMDSELTDEELAETVKSNLEEIDRLTNIIRFLLTFSSLENRLTNIQLEPVNLNKAFTKAAKLAKGKAAEKNIRLSVEPGKGELAVAGNLALLEELAQNLLGNAIAYTPAGGWIRARTIRENGNVVLSVADSGVGIPPKDIANVFEPFYRGTNTAYDKSGRSAGLGLTIVREIAGAHHAIINVESKLGKGTKIDVKFPK
ncbi:MAG: HAMP domain-containing histidine kinase [Patescibacteria group bacterium]|nr:HAMP domain-containing histidine kinase [Patescibacteria group bacterium]